MKQNTKDWIQYGSAIALIVSAILIACASIIYTMDIGAGALTYIGEAISGALAIFGITAYAIARIKETKDEILKELQTRARSEESGEDTAP